MPATMTAAQKAAKKKQRMAAKKLPAPPPPVRSLRRLDVFEGVSAKVMEALETKAIPATITRDAMLFEPGAPAASEQFMHFVIAGQVGVGEHTEEAHKAIGKKAKAELFKKVGQTWAVFAAGDFWSDGFCAVAGDLCMYAITETQTIKVKSSDIAEILKRHPAVRDRRFPSRSDCDAATFRCGPSAGRDQRDAACGFPQCHSSSLGSSGSQ